MNEISKKTFSQNNLNTIKKNSTFIKSLILGTVSLSAYIILFMNEEWVIQNFSKGDYYAAFPILTALFFSFIHGAFSSNFIYTLGLKEKVLNKK